MRNPGFHYVRKARADGGVHAADGRAPGQDLQTLLAGGPPPIKVALEIIAAICEILYFAEDDGEVHGDVHPRNVVIASDGAVAIQGFGRRLRETWAPERRIAGPATDRYGLGYTAYRLLAEHDLDDRAVTADAHEAAVVDAVVGLPLADLPLAWARDIQYLIARLLDWDTDDRPDPYTVWLSFVAFANDAPGTALAPWAQASLRGQIERRDLARARQGAVAEEKLEGPVVRGAGLKPGAFKPADPEPAGEVSTRFFTRDELRSALGAAGEDTDALAADDPYAPRAHEQTAFFTRAQWRDAAAGPADAPRPVRSDAARPATIPPPFRPDDEDDDERTEPGGAATPPPARPRPPVPPPPPPPQPRRPSLDDPPPKPKKPRRKPEPPPKSGGGLLPALGCAVVVLTLACAGVAGIAALLVVLSAMPGGLAIPSAPPPPTPEPAAQPAPAAKPPPADTTAPKPAAEPAPAPKPAAQSPASDRPSRVVFTVPGKGTLTCDDGNKAELDGRGSVTFRKFPKGGVSCSFKAGIRTVCTGSVGSDVRKCACDGATGQLTCS
jgi:hypothetical protein